MAENTKQDRTFTVDDAISLARERARRDFPVKVIGGNRYTQCPASDHDDSFKIKLYDDGYSCARCGQGGNVPSLFMHLLHKTEYIQSGKDAAKIMHSMVEGESPAKPRKPVQVEVVSEAPEVIYEVADIKIRDKTYRALLALLVLEKPDLDDLLRRGLTEEDVKTLGYKTAPRNPKEICKKLLNSGYILEGVPGFYVDEDGAWTLRDLGQGYYIPFRNGFGQIQFMQIRTRKKLKDGVRYLSLSTRSQEQGTPAKAWAHIHKGSSPEWWKRIVITEGALKADIASILSGETFIAVPGVGSIGDLPRVLRDLTYLGLEHVTLAYDMDDVVNENVQKGEARIREMLGINYLEIPFTKCIWDGTYKGIDDWLFNYKKQFKEEG